MNERSLLGAGTLALLLLAPAIASAEISVVGGNLRFETGDGQTWAPLRSELAGIEVLNPFGDARGDSPPAVARNPVTDAFEAAWGLGGASPGVAFARHDAETGAWSVTRVPAVGASSRWAGRTPSLGHDSQGNAYILFEDPEAGLILLASVARGSLRVNPPLVLATPQRPGASPAMLWDGEELVVAFVRADSPDRLQVNGLQPEWDADGRIPEGGEGIPGIPEPIFGFGGTPGSLPLQRPLGEGGAAPGLGGSAAPAALDLSAPPPLLQLEELDGSRLLVTWIVGERLLWSLRTAGAWSDPDWLPLEDPLQEQESRRRLREALGGRVPSGSARNWNHERRAPEALELPGQRR